MNRNIIGAFIAAAIGLFIAFINYRISEKVIIKAPEKYSLITVVRQILQVGFLAMAYFVGVKTQAAEPTYLLVGAVVGMTFPMFFFTKKLIDLNDSVAVVKKEKEVEDDG